MFIPMLTFIPRGNGIPKGIFRLNPIGAGKTGCFDDSPSLWVLIFLDFSLVSLVSFSFAEFFPLLVLEEEKVVEVFTCGGIGGNPPFSVI